VEHRVGEMTMLYLTRAVVFLARNHRRDTNVVPVEHVYRGFDTQLRTATKLAWSQPLKGESCSGTVHGT